MASKRLVRWEQQQKDLATLQAISGVDDPDAMGFRVEENYLRREYYENKLMAGFSDVPEEFKPQQRSEREKDIYRREKALEQIEQARTNYNPFDMSKYQVEDEDIPYSAKSMSVEII